MPPARGVLDDAERGGDHGGHDQYDQREVVQALPDELAVGHAGRHVARVGPERVHAVLEPRGVVPVEEIDKLVAGLEAYPNAVILSDEVYSWILYGGREHVSLLNYPQIRDRLILLEGWSKTYAMTGWRIGYGVFPENLFPHVERLAVNSYSCVNAATQHAAIAALEGPDDDIHKMVKAFNERRELIVRELNTIPGFRCADPGGAFYAFPNIEGTGMDSQTLQQKLLEETGVAVVSGTSFGALGQGYLRFSYAASSEDITNAISRIRGLLS